MHQSIRPSLVQIMACRLFGDNPLSDSMLDYCHLEPWEQISMKFLLQLQHFHSRKCIWKCRLPWQSFCLSLNVLDLIIWSIMMIIYHGNLSPVNKETTGIKLWMKKYIGDKNKKLSFLHCNYPILHNHHIIRYAYSCEFYIIKIKVCFICYSGTHFTSDL